MSEPAINGSLGRFLERMRWWGGVLIIPLLLTAGGWIIRVEVFHAEVKSFMSPGPRFVGNADFQSAQDLYRQVMLDVGRQMSTHAGAGPHPGVTERLEAIDKRLDALQQTQREILLELRRR